MWSDAKRVLNSMVYVADIRSIPAGLLSETFIRRLPALEQIRISRLRREPDKKRSH